MFSVLLLCYNDLESSTFPQHVISFLATAIREEDVA